MRVVDLLEVVEVDDHQRAVRAVARVAFGGQRELPVEVAPVGQSGEGIVVGEVFDPGLETASLGQVGQVQQNAVLFGGASRQQTTGDIDQSVVPEPPFHGTDVLVFGADPVEELSDDLGVARGEGFQTAARQ